MLLPPHNVLNHGKSQEQGHFIDERKERDENIFTQKPVSLIQKALFLGDINDPLGVDGFW